MTLDEAIKRYKNHSKCIQQTLITKEEAVNVYELLQELKQRRKYENGCQYCKYKFRSDEDEPCVICSHNYTDKYCPICGAEMNGGI
jgi:rRNA maturation endonuclease Nob1